MNERAVFIAALEKDDPVERAAFLDQACADDLPLRQRIERLLKAHEPADSFLERRPPGLGVTVDEQPTAEHPGTTIGSYKLLQHIGEGGMGVVFMAEQQQPVRRKVALKIVKPGMDSKQVIARFEAERQALALMDHQHIAKVFDAGTTDSGRPYFVMELVHGVPITKYCDDHHLTPNARLELFLPVCHAVQHAHQKGIIHRDLKPSNVLVCLYDGAAVPKVIDFGVAKATGQQLTERTMFTQFGTLVGTLEYMSPEQAEMSQLGIDTRSDVYSLGVLLYELLTGTTPLERHRLREAGFDEFRRLIREEEPPKPSTRLSTSGVALAAISAQRQTEPAQLTRLVRGELDWIVMKALEKDRNGRYETANELARDVEHYLHDEPVEACPPTAGYRLGKFARKHQKLLATAAAFVALLLLGIAGSGWQAVRASQAEQQANANAARAQEKEQEANQQRDEAQQQRDEARALAEKLQVALEQLRRTTYAAHMNLAHNAWEANAGNAERVRKLLEQHRPKPGETDLRGFEWYYLYRLCHSDLLTLKGVGSSVAYSPDGRRLAGPSDDNTVKVWDAQTGQELLTFKGHTDEAFSVAFSPDGKRLASTAYDKTVKVWDGQTGQELLTFKGHTAVAFSVAFSPDGQRLASTAGDQTVKVWDGQTGQELLSLKGHPGPRHDYRVAFSPDGKRLASQSVDNTMKVWDAQTGQELLTLKDGSTWVVFSPDGKRLASGKKVWDAQTGQELLALDRGAITAFSPDGKRLAGLGKMRGDVTVWDAQTGQEILTFKGHTGSVGSVAFSPDGKRLASACWDGTVKIWDVTTSPKARTLMGHTNSVISVAYSPDGQRLASAGGGEVKVWDAQTGQVLHTFPGRASGVAFSPDGKRLAGSHWDSTVKVWDAQTGQELLTFKGHTGGSSVAFSPDGKRLASASGAHDEQAKPLPGEVKVWDAQTGQELLTLKGTGTVGRGTFSSVVFSPDGKRLASGGIPVKVWDAQTGQVLHTFPGRGSGVAFSPDGQRLASGARDGTMMVWDAQSGRELLTLTGHTADVWSVAFSPAGKRLATLSRDQTVKVWDAQTGQETLTLEGRSPSRGLAFSPDGHRLASADGSMVKIWDATPLLEKP